ncbi:EAL domain-containing protein [Ciceribacter sp. L1K23]|uniref:putative bifunctional diguanylate cyclase/phosphodiesterase n=1 Tax=Ciceribacter sp. L1K23 TaxID=2820276 RepID=UPI001B837882|nr:EAL domain-containing protein [Ciceribacter sp. L1K23]MBR0556158.1 EAL domain-containing protein [Ciceribacter sp. L1K23]
MTHVLADMIETDFRSEPMKPAPESLRSLYDSESESKRKQVTRHGLWIAVAAYLLYSLTDVLFLRDVAAQTVAGRFAVGIVSLCLLELTLRLRASANLVDVLAATAVLSGYVVWLLTGWNTAETASFSYYMVFGAIFMMSLNLFFSFRFPVALAASTTTMAIFLGSLYAYMPMDLIYKLILGAFCISCFVFTSYVNLQLNRERFKVFLNALEARLQQNASEERGKALLRLSNTDPLTGLENRRAVDQRLRTRWQDWQENGVMFAVLLVDVDFFKRYNDCYGHQEGDRCLTTVAKGLYDAISHYDAAIGRYGGEEFIVIARVEDQKEVADLAETICRSVREMALPHGQRRDGISIVTVSVGASLTRGQSVKLEKIIHEADRALYTAKANGRNGVKLFDPDDPQSSDESEHIAAILKIALEQKLVSLVYQPIRGVQSGTIEAAEALMRLKMLDGAPVSPAVFIPIAERTGAIIELGRWAIRTVCVDLLAKDLVQVVSVNVSPIQLKMPGFAASVALILAETGVSGGRLAFEITEGVEMEMNSDILRCISDLKKMGVQIWLDDFGTGFAGLSWLRLIDFDTVKIDRSFLHDCDQKRGRTMMQDIISLLRNRTRTILVEGVETGEQQALMEEYKIDHLQGYHVGRPVPVEQFTAAPKKVEAVARRKSSVRR